MVDLSDNDQHSSLYIFATEASGAREELECLSLSYIFPLEVSDDITCKYQARL
jgi:hypothetical protein